MQNSDKVKFQILREIFDRNYKITRLYADYLQLYPELITREMVDTLTEDGDITREEAISAILCEVFGLDFDRGVEDRILIRDYINRSVRILDTKKYENDPYYKNIRLENIKDGSWELRWESYAPYRAVICGDMILNPDFSEIPPLGFFTDEFRFPAVLEAGNEWMTLTPVDLDTCTEAIDAAHGKVVTFGLGLGYYAYMVSEKTEVESITVIEKSPDVIRLFKEHILPQFPNRDKVRIIETDAFEYAENTMPNEHFDLAFVDTWRDASDGAPMYERMKALEHLSSNTKFLYWIENFLISRLRATRFEELCEKAEHGEPISYPDILAQLENIP